MKTNIPIMINGKVKGSIPVDTDDSEVKVTSKAMNIKSVNEVIKSTKKRKIIYIPGKLFNVVVE